MKTMIGWTSMLLALILFSGFSNRDNANSNASTENKPLTWNIWPGEAPGGPVELPPETDITLPTDTLIAGERIIKLHNVTVPTISIYKPDPSIDTKTAVIIAPGGGFWILAMDLEGTEIAEWLNTLGVTGIVLKYRVPGNAWDSENKWLTAVQDGQRAMSLVRGRAEEIGIDPNKIGIMGFSAGGAPVAGTALRSQRLYEAVDEYDKVSFRPDFAAPIYSGGLPEDANLTEDCPPFFMATAGDDFNPLEMARMYIALKEANISAELHIYESGGHGYGLRQTDLPVTSWHDRMEDWMRTLKLL